MAIQTADDADDEGDSTSGTSGAGTGSGGSGGSGSGGDDHHYDGGTDVLDHPGILSDLHPFVPPPVPGGDGQGGTSVSTPSLDLFASHIDLLIQPVRDVATGLDEVAVAPGAFYHANVMRSTVNGPNADGGLKKSYGSALSALVRGLTDLRDGARTLSRKYATAEEDNSLTAADLADAMTSATADFNTMMTSNGGSAMTSGAGTGSTSTGTGDTNTTTA
ncbi:hypothetical protein [Streptomyces ziwulingensis]|uniref:ESX-1 secretion-associated protein n=1 Tax=Streptomyces ziwulingensis TaxID=1045501 RepID=A0ABP9BEX5_9ACTN